MSTISFSKDEKAWTHVLGDHQVCSDNATKPLETGKSQLLLAACPAGIDQTAASARALCAVLGATIKIH